MKYFTVYSNAGDGWTYIGDTNIASMAAAMARKEHEAGKAVQVDSCEVPVERDYLD